MTKDQLTILSIVGIVIFAGLAWLASWGSECPRILMGYNCKGDKCNHSEEELDKAYAALRDRQR